MNLREIIPMAWAALRSSGARAVLTLVGMSIGVFSVIAAVTAVGVLEDTLVQGLSEMGSGTFTITRYPAMRPPTDEEQDRRPLTYEQSLRLRERARLPVSVSASTSVNGRQIKTETESTDPNITVNGVEPAYGENNSAIDLVAGRFLTEADMQSSRAVVVLGSTVREELFGDFRAVGQTVRIDGRRYRVIGELAPQSGGFGLGDRNLVAYVPIGRVLTDYGLAGEDVTIDVRAPSPEMLAATEGEIIGQLRAIRRVSPEAENDFDVSSSEAFAEQFRGVMQAIAFGGAGIGLIALLAAGVGVMNVMLVSVTERTREIGVRKALGARRRDILLQFLTEAILLCQVGGLIGILLGVLGGNVLAAVLQSAPAFPWGWALVAIVGVTGVALLFGVYPAQQAARLHPIEALRYE